MTGELPVVGFRSAAEWDEWLSAEHARSAGVWLKIPKKDGSAGAGLTYDAAVEVALCHGWIDGQKRALDADHWLQRFTPRRPGSRWSKINRDRAERLVETGAMRPAGLAEVDKAKADGRWDAACAGQRTATVPEDLRRALDADPVAAQNFAGLDSVNRYAILYRLQDAKRPETRARRLEKFVTMLAEGRKLHP